MTDGEAVTIENDDSRLFMVRDAVRYRMVPVAPDTFYVPGLDVMVGFARASDSGPLSKIHVASSLDERWGVRVD